MKNSTRILFSAAAALLFSFSAYAAKVGEKAPDFTLEDISGQEHSLSDFSGKIVVLEWVNHGCPYVKKHYRSGGMQSVQSDMADKEVVWLSICSSAPGKQGYMSNSEWVATIESKGMKSAAVLVDADGKVGRLLGARATPHMFVIDEEGALAYNGAIDSIRSANSADVDRAENYVVSAVEALIKGEPVAKRSTKPYGCSVKYARRDS